MAPPSPDKDPLDFGPYEVEQADEYYQGPHRSTRVQAHQFIPIGDDDEPDSSTSVLSRNQFAYWQTRGYIYVRFWKKNTLWRYGPCTLNDYRDFRESGSKGRHVRMLEGFPHGAAVEVDGLDI